MPRGGSARWSRSRRSKLSPGPIGPNCARRRYGKLEELAGREGGTAQDAAFHSLRWLAEGGGPATARTLAVDALGAIARRPDGSFRQPAATALQQIAKAEDGEAAKAAREALGRLWRTNRLERLLERAAPPEQ